MGNKIDIKNTVLKNIIPCCCVAVGIILFLSGLGLKVLPAEIAPPINYTTEVTAILRGAQIVGAHASKAIYIAFGLLIVCISALKIELVKSATENNHGE